jgi:hypothetical protein
MSLTHDTRNKLGMGMVLLAPANYEAGPFHHRVDRTSYDLLLAGAQRLRGKIYVRDGAISPSLLTDDGRHMQQVDNESWHLLIVNEQSNIKGCVRYCLHSNNFLFSDLEVSRSSVLVSKSIGPSVRRAVQRDIEQASLLGFSYIELGGWAISEEFRCTTEVIRMVLMIYAFGQLNGGAYGLSTVTTRHHSSSILRRLGGRSLVDLEEEIHPYYDPDYGCEMELLTFNSTKPNPRYAGWIDDCRYVLSNLSAIAPGLDETRAYSLLQLDRALSDNAGRRSELDSQVALQLKPGSKL